MNEPSNLTKIASAETACTRRFLDDVEDFARKDPVAASAAAFGVGLLLTVLPARAVFGTAAALSATFVRPTLLTLGVIKGLELCCSKNSENTQTPHQHDHP